MATAKAVVVKTVKLADIRGHEALQMRDGLDPDRVERFRQMVGDGEEFEGKPPVVFHDANAYWLADGYTRMAAYAAAGKKAMACEVRPGTFDDAVLYAAGANTRHGLPLQTTGEKTKAINTVLMHPEGRTWTDAEVAKYVGCSRELVGNARHSTVNPLTVAGDIPTTLSDRQTEKWKQVVESGGTPRLSGRTDSQGDRVVINVSKIGSTRKPGDRPVALVKQLASVAESDRRKAVWLGIPAEKVGRLERALAEDGTRVWLSEDEDAAGKLADQLGIPAEAVTKRLQETPPADPDADPTPEPAAPDPDGPVDAKGRPIPADIREAFDPELQTKLRSLVQRYGHDFADLKALIEQRHPGMAWAWLQGLQTDYGNLQNALSALIPHIVCPACGGTKKEAGDIIPDGPDCQFCKRTGYLPHGSWKGLTDEMKAVAESFAKPKGD